MRYLIKEVKNCSNCDYYCDEGEFCKHPYWGKILHVIPYKYLVPKFIIPEDCPLPDSLDK